MKQASEFFKHYQVNLDAGVPPRKAVVDATRRVAAAHRITRNTVTDLLGPRRGLDVLESLRQGDASPLIAKLAAHPATKSDLPLKARKHRVAPAPANSVPTALICQIKTPNGAVFRGVLYPDRKQMEHGS